MQQSSTYIREIFTSLQGEGPYTGQKQIFVRTCCCNLACKFCDTDFLKKNAKLYSISDLFENLKNNDAETVSFTGGEPLEDVDFLYDFLINYKKLLNKKIYLETNGTMPDELAKIIDLIDIISMDIKIKSATGQENQFKKNADFLRIAAKKEVFVKVVFDKNILDEEIESIVNIVSKYNTLLVLQPKMPLDKDLKIELIYDKFYKKYKNVRLIPQVHKFLNLL